MDMHAYVPTKDSLNLDVRRNVAAWVSYKMRQMRLNQAAMAKLMGVRPATVSRVAGGQRTAGFDFVIRFSKEFSVPLEVLAYTAPPKMVVTGAEVSRKG